MINCQNGAFPKYRPCSPHCSQVGLAAVPMVLTDHYGLTSGFMPSALFWCEVPAFYSEPPKGSLPLSSLLVPQLWRYRKPPVGRCQLYSSGTTFVVQGLNRVTSGLCLRHSFRVRLLLYICTMGIRGNFWQYQFLALFWKHPVWISTFKT